jgi:hypothetical protein
LTPANAREMLLNRLYWEQIEQLKLLFTLYYTGYETKSVEVAAMLDYLTQNHYAGQLQNGYYVSVVQN